MLIANGNENITWLGGAALTCVAEVDELFGKQVCEQLHDEQQILVLVLLCSRVASLPAAVFGVDLQERQTRFIQLHGFGLRTRETEGTLYLISNEIPQRKLLFCWLF